MSGLPSSPLIVGTSAGPSRAESVRVRRAEGYHAWLMLFVAANLGTVWLLWQHHFGWATLVFFSPAPWYSWQVLKPSARGLGPVVTTFSTSQREVWLTIDDGPDPASTPAILKLLEERKSRATFFLVGEKVRRHPELVSEILRHGHSLGNHTFSHPQHSFWCATARQNAAEIDGCAAALREAGAGPSRYFRSPVGLKNHALHPELLRRDMDLVLWTARGFDTVAGDFEKAFARIATRLRPGAILLAHETPDDPGRQKAFLSGLFALLEKEGYHCIIPSNDSLIR